MRCRTPKSAKRSGSSRHERGRWANIRLGEGQGDRGTRCQPRRAPSCRPTLSPTRSAHQWAGQFMGLRERVSAPALKEKMWAL